MSDTSEEFQDLLLRILGEVILRNCTWLSQHFLRCLMYFAALLYAIMHGIVGYIICNRDTIGELAGSCCSN